MAAIKYGPSVLRDVVVLTLEAHERMIAALREIAALDKHSGASLRQRAASEIAREALAALQKE